MARMDKLEIVSDYLVSDDVSDNLRIWGVRVVSSILMAIDDDKVFVEVPYHCTKNFSNSPGIIRRQMHVADKESRSANNILCFTAFCTLGLILILG
jgi:hypothetical protein